MVHTVLAAGCPIHSNSPNDRSQHAAMRRPGLDLAQLTQSQPNPPHTLTTLQSHLARACSTNEGRVRGAEHWQRNLRIRGGHIASTLHQGTSEKRGEADNARPVVWMPRRGEGGGPRITQAISSRQHISGRFPLHALFPRSLPSHHSHQYLRRMLDISHSRLPGI